MSFSQNASEQRFELSRQEMFQTAQAALYLSCNATTQEAINEATMILGKLSQLDGYLPALVAVLHSSASSTAMAALAQIKNYVRSNWHNSFHPSGDPTCGISQSDRQQFLQSLFATNLSLCGNYQHSKIIKDIIGCVAFDAVRDYEPAVECFEQRVHLHAALNFLLGITAGMQHDFNKLRRQTFNELLGRFLPTLSQVIEDGSGGLGKMFDDVMETARVLDGAGCEGEQYGRAMGEYQLKLSCYRQQEAYFNEVVYLSIKFMCKVLHVGLEDEFRDFAIRFSRVAMNRLATSNEEHSREVREGGSKGDDKFNYHHGRKWAAKYLKAFLEKVLIIKGNDPQLSSSTRGYLHAEFDRLVQIVRAAFAQPSPRKMRRQLLNFLSAMVSTRRKAYLVRYGEELQYYLVEMLPPLLLWTGEDARQMRESPAEFMNCDGDVFVMREKTDKQLAGRIWADVAFLDSPFLHGTVCEANQLIRFALQQIAEWIGSEREQLQEIGSYLFNVLATKMRCFPSLNPQLVGLASLAVTRLLASPSSILQIRALDIVCNYWPYISEELRVAAKGYLLGKLTDPVLAGAIRSDCEESGEGERLVLAMRCVRALEKYIFTPELRQLSGEEAKQIMGVLIELVEVFEHEDLLRIISSVIDFYHHHLQEHSCFLIQLMTDKFMTYMRREQQEMNSPAVNLTGPPLLDLANSALSVLGIFINYIAPGPEGGDQTRENIRVEVEKNLLLILQHVLSQPEEEMFEYVRNVLGTLNCYLHNYYRLGRPLPQELDLYFSVFVVRMVGVDILSPPAQSYLESLPNPTLRRMYLSCRVNDHDNYQSYLVLFRNYIKFMDPREELSSFTLVCRNLLAGNKMDQLLFVVVRFIKPPKGRSLENVESARILACYMLIYLMENHGQQLGESVCFRILQVIRALIPFYMDNPFLIKLNMQVFCLWLWAFQERAAEKLKTVPAGRINLFVQTVLAMTGEFGLREIWRDPVGSFDALRRVMLGLTSLYKLNLVHGLGLNNMHQYLHKLTLIASHCSSFRNVDPQDEEEYYEENGSLGSQEGEHEEKGEEQAIRTSYLQGEAPAFQEDDDNVVIEMGSHSFTGWQRDTWQYQLDECAQQNYVSALDSFNEVVYFLDMLLFVKVNFSQVYNECVLKFYNEVVIEVILNQNLERSERYSGLYYGTIAEYFQGLASAYEDAD